MTYMCIRNHPPPPLPLEVQMVVTNSVYAPHLKPFLENHPLLL